MKYLLSILVLVLGNVALRAQDSALITLRSIPVVVVDLAVDHLDNLYIVTATDQLKKYNARGDSLGVFNQVRRHGRLHSIDVTNPLKLLLYYKDFSTIVVLDRLLTPRSTLELRRHGIIQTSAIGLSYDNNIWLFDEYEHKLRKINEEGSRLMETADFRMIFSEPVLPQQIIDQNGTVYLYDPQNGLYLFDYYGGFKKKLPITHWNSISITEPYITGVADNQFHYFNASVMLSGQKALPVVAGQLLQYRIANHKLFSWSSDSLHIYHYPF